MVRDLGKWRPGFYTEFRCASREHSGLPWGAIFEKVTQNKEIHTFSKWVCSKIPEIVFFPGQKPRRVRQDIKELLRIQRGSLENSPPQNEGVFLIISKTHLHKMKVFS